MIKRKQAILFILFSIPVCFTSSCYYSKSTAKKILHKAESAAPYDIIIVPGIQFTNGKWDKTMKGRIYWSKYLFEKGIAKNIMYSGNSVYSPHYEAEIMKLYAVAIGIPADHIYTEKKAEHSTENAYYSYKYAKKLGFNRIALASDPFQTRTLRSFIRKRISRDVGLLPFVSDTLKAMEPSMTDPQIDYQQAFNKDFISITKRDSFWKRLRGTIKGNIDTTAYQ
ncbi:MAG: YdcF family protein [Bacteroidetes bacterium]|nr:YdcF family protein [Bacteroidota bacterium]